jgi:WD40 repeat protein
MWNPVTGKMIRLFPDHPEVAHSPYTLTYAVAFDGDGKRLATVGKNLFTIWESETGRIIHKIQTHANVHINESAVLFSPDGRRVATGTRGGTLSGDSPVEIKLWDAQSGEQLSRLTAPGPTGHSLLKAAMCFTPDGARIAASTGSDRVSVWDCESSQIVMELRGHTGEVFGLAISPDGRRFATASNDQTIKIWDADVGQELLTLRGHAAPVVTVAFSPDGRYLASANASKPSQVKLWDAGPNAESGKR